MTEKKEKDALSEHRARYGEQVPIATAAIGTRIGEIADAVGGNSALAKFCEVTEGTVRNWRSGSSEPTASNLVAIARAGGVTVEWLATGAGPKHPGEMVSAEDYAFIPLYDVGASAGYGAFINGEASTDALAFKRDWLRQQIGARIKDLAIINVRGDSMEPTLRDRDVIMLDRGDTDVSDGIYVFLLDGFLWVKRLQPRIGEDGKMELVAISDNPARGTFDLPSFEGHDEPTRIIGRVVWAGRRF